LDLKTSTVHRKLDARLKIAGLEAPDLLAVLLFAAVMNLIFGQSILALPMVIVLPSILLLILFFGKRDKPDSFLIHLLRYHLTPGFYSAGDQGVYENLKQRRIIEKSPKR
jgi:hypothetical protein